MVKHRQGWVALFLLGALTLGAALPAAGASEKDKIDAIVEALIDAFRRGDYAAMGQYYASDCTVVSADYKPPVVGWENVERRYRAQHATLIGAEMLRENTRVMRRGNVAWVSYQWRFAGLSETGTLGVEGHTTLVLEKQRGRWLIRHNHTSAVAVAVAPPVATPQQSRPAAPPVS